MRDEALMKRLREAFREESTERLDGMSKQLVRLEKAGPEDDTADALDLFYRDVHSLKGAARAVQFPGVEEISQAVEDVLSALQEGDLQLGDEALDLLHESLGVLGRVVEASRENLGAELDVEGRNMVARLSAAMDEGIPDSSSAPPPSPADQAEGADPLDGSPETARETGHTTAKEPTRSIRPDSAQGDTRPFLAESIRVPVRKLDSLLRKAEEFVELKLATQAQLRAFAKAAHKASGAERELQDVLREGEHHLFRLSSMVDGLLKEMKDVTLLPISILFELLPVMVRDLCRAQGKQVALSLKGGEVQIDRRVLEEIKDPLVHLIRNAIDHGFRGQEPDEDESPGWTIEVEASQVDANLIAVEVADNGRGMDVDSISDAAVEMGLASRSSVEDLPKAERLSLAYSSGLSTNQEVTAVSGRGLGLSVVNAVVEHMGGTLSVQSEPGQGTRFRMVLPVTLATVRGLVVQAGGSRFVVPTSEVRRVTRVPKDGVQMVNGKTAFAEMGDLLRLTQLTHILGLAPDGERNESSPGQGSDAYLRALVLGEGSNQVALHVDEVQGEVEVLAKNLGPQLGHVRHISGATKLGDGSLALILNTRELMDTIQGGKIEEVHQSLPPESPRKGPSSILVVEDSITSRTLLRNVLESAGYEVTTAVDGREALTLLKSRPFDAVVSDVEMPRLGGLGLTETIRADKDLTRLPVILVSSLDRPEHREAGIRAGADAYVGKSSFDQANLLDVVRRYC